MEILGTIFSKEKHVGKLPVLPMLATSGCSIQRLQRSTVFDFINVQIL